MYESVTRFVRVQLKGLVGKRMSEGTLKFTFGLKERELWDDLEQNGSAKYQNTNGDRDASQNIISQIFCGAGGGGVGVKLETGEYFSMNSESYKYYGESSSQFLL